MSFVYHAQDASHLTKHGIDLMYYDENLASVNVVRIQTDQGHFEEFYNTVSDFVYSVTDGYGTFVLDDVRYEVAAGDLVVAPARTRIHYFGKLDMILSVAPAFNEDNEVHVRNIDKSESPYYKESV